MLRSCLFTPRIITISSLSGTFFGGYRTLTTSSRKTNKPKPKMSALWSPESVVPQNIKDLLVDTSGSSATNHILAFIQIVRLLKVQKRTGWLDHKVDPLQVESISDHMYRMSIISMCIPNDKIDKDRCAKIALIHDIAEALVGDITPFDPVPKEEKHRRELITIEYLAQIIKPYNESFSHEIMELWLDYEEIRTLEARYVKDIDKFEMIQQAFEYEVDHKGTKNLDQFFRARSSIKTDEISQLCDALLEKRTVFWADINKN